MDALKQFGKAGTQMSAAQSHTPSHLPNGSSRLSAPSNEVSGIRSLANKARHASGQGHPHHNHQQQQPQQQAGYSYQPRSGGHHNASSPTRITDYDQELESSQRLYDKRFHAPEAAAHSAHSAMPARHPNGGPHDNPPPRGHSQSSVTGSYASHQLGPGAANVTGSMRTASPAPSATSNTSGFLKDKKRLKNPFSFKR